jgi:hypothetical protein
MAVFPRCYLVGPNKWLGSVVVDFLPPLLPPRPALVRKPWMII